MPKEKAWGYEGRGDFFQEEDGCIQKEAPFVYTDVQILHPQKLGAYEPEYFKAKVFLDAMREAKTFFNTAKRLLEH